MEARTIDAMVAIVEHLQTEADEATHAALDAIALARTELDLAEKNLKAAAGGKKKYDRPVAIDTPAEAIFKAFDAVAAEQAIWARLRESANVAVAEDTPVEA